MIKSTFSFDIPHRYVIYARMSDETQNARSPEQQVDTIQTQLSRCGWPWTQLALYIDRGVSGRRTHTRPQFQKMLNDIRSGRVKADVLLVDTAERFSRADEALELRRELERSGVIMLTADTGFSDPTTSAGQLYSMIECWRAGEENRVKSHNVLRGKRDSVRQKQWPGGPPPLGYKLKSVTETIDGVVKVLHSILIPDPETQWIVQRMFHIALTEGWGMGRIARRLNEDPSIPAKFKPFNLATVGRQLVNRIYIGEMVWERLHCDIRNDARIVERTDEADWTIVPDFCEPIIDRQSFDHVQMVRKDRAAKIQANKETASAGKRACGTGIALKYLLSGLVVCSECGRAMNINVTKAYLTKDGESKTYPAYMCAGRLSGTCENALRVPEPWLRETVVGLIRLRLFGIAQTETILSLDGDAIARSAWYTEIVPKVQAESLRITRSQPDERKLKRARAVEIATQQSGRMKSLLDPELNPELRQELQVDYTAAKQELKAIEEDIRSSEAQLREVNQVVDPVQIATTLNSLADVMASQNISAANLILAKHIDVIECAKDGLVSVHTCKLGALSDCIGLIQQNPAEVTRLPNDRGGVYPATARKRTRRQVEGDVAEDRTIDALNHTVLSPVRFAGLGPEWFWIDTFNVPENRCWSEEHALEVAQFRIANRASQSAVASHFGVSAPTVRKALLIAKDLGIDATDGAMKLDRKPDWAQANAVAVARFVDERRTTIRNAADHFQKSEPTISKALQIGRRLQAD